MILTESSIIQNEFQLLALHMQNDMISMNMWTSEEQNVAIRLLPMSANSSQGKLQGGSEASEIFQLLSLF